MATYLKNYYLNDRKLAQRALLEFHRALVSGRVIAFTGAMTTQGFGYGNWGELISKFVNELLPRALRDKNDDQARLEALGLMETRARIAAWATAPQPPFDQRVALSMIGELVDRLDSYYPLSSRKRSATHPRPKLRSPEDVRNSRLENLELQLALYFREKKKPAIDGPEGIIESIWRDIGINRFATLNYDFELERMLMLTGKEQQKGSAFKKLTKLRRKGSLFWGEQSSRISRILPNGRTVESDIVKRERVDRIIDFAVGSDDAEQHILHLHGRADDQKSLIFSYRDYDKHYRRTDMNRTPFEYGQRIMMGGNPILFVGLGMAEAEINRTLEDFISNSPYHRSAPTFLLWNSRRLSPDGTCREMDAVERSNFRADKLHRLGVLTIFDTDLCGEEEVAGWDWKAYPEDGLMNLAKACRQLPQVAEQVGQRENHIGAQWRSMKTRVDGVSGSAGPICMWHVDSTPNQQRHAACDRILESLKDNQVINIATGPAGWGKGSLAYEIAHAPESELPVPKNRRMFISAGFCFDSDSMLDAIARFLGKVGNKPYNPENGPKTSRRRYFESDESFACKGSEALIIINGMERFFDGKGIPLSSELDQLLRMLNHKFGHCDDHCEFAGSHSQESRPSAVGRSNVRWLFLGSDRFRFYAEALFGKDVTDAHILEPNGDAKRNLATDTPPTLISTFLTGIAKKDTNSKVWEGFSETQRRSIVLANEEARHRTGEGRRASIDKLRRSFLDAYLEPVALNNAGIDTPALAIEILRAMAFIGLPSEQKVLEHVPRIRAKLDKNRNGRLEVEEQAKITTALEQLVEAKFVTKFAGFEDYGAGGTKPPIRFGLHRAIMTEMRFRLGLPLSEAKLSTSFNMSLYVAQPVDGFIPEPDIHDELGLLIDRLIGAYKDNDHGWPAPNAKAAKALQRYAARQPMVNRTHPKELASEVEELHRICHRDSVACLRSALSVMRGYYSTTGLLTLDKDDRLIKDERDAILLEHAERIDCLIDGYGKMTGARAALGELKALEEYGSAEPFYPDELVWLHNERAVVRLAMGDLHEASRSFMQALAINKDHVEYGDTSHNWRRIRLNQLTAEIESAEIYSAERIIREILEASGWPPDDRSPTIQWDGLKKYSREDKLAIAIARGYQGMCSMVRGEVLDARDDFQFTCELLRNLDEQRAFAYFARLYAVALRNAGQHRDSAQYIDLAIDAAQSTKQMDLVHRSHIVKFSPQIADASLSADERQKAMQAIADALDYAIATGTHRVRTEAAAGMAKAKRASGDHEVAMQYAAEAITIATRYGLKLRMIAYRVNLGEILFARGDPNTGRELIRGAVKSANRIGYQRAVDAGQTALAKMT